MKIKGLLFILRKASATENPITNTIGIKEYTIDGKNLNIANDRPPPPAKYMNCLNVIDPKILSSTSMNCGTWYLIILLYHYIGSRYGSDVYFLSMIGLDGVGAGGCGFGLDSIFACVWFSSI